MNEEKAEKIAAKKQLEQVQLKALRQVNAADRQVKLLKAKDASVQKLKRRVHNEKLLRIEVESDLNGAKQSLAEVSHLLAQEMLSSAQVQEQHGCMQREIKSATRKLQAFGQQDISFQELRRQANVEQERRQFAEKQLKVKEQELHQVRKDMAVTVETLEYDTRKLLEVMEVKVQTLEHDNDRLQGLLKQEASQRFENTLRLAKVTQENNAMVEKVKAVQCEVDAFSPVALIRELRVFFFCFKTQHGAPSW